MPPSVTYSGLSGGNRPDVMHRIAFWAALLIVLALTALTYQRGLHGVFLFDDFANLPSLGAFGPVDNWTAFWRYITSGTADPTGRPLALLSFLIDAQNWPADPYPFKRTSLVLHLVNGVLLALLLRRLGRVLRPSSPRQTDLAAVLGAALWLLHPLFISTTLYVVQREAMLPATFMLLGLLGYCRGRDLAAQGYRRGPWLCAGAIGMATLLAVASKANGILLPLLTLLIEALLLAPCQPIADGLRTRFNWMRRVVLSLPSTLLLLWLAYLGLHLTLQGLSSFRPWTLPERLMTEARIVCEYLSLLWLPHPYTAGLFNDAITVSTGLLAPPSTLVAIAFLAGLLATAVAVRRRAPALALAVLFYFVAQLLESTVVPLELYYEHRNYVPAMLMFWPLALWLTQDGAASVLRCGLAALLVLILAGMTFLNADLWGDAQEQALVWAAKNPDSPRAQAYAAAAERAMGRPDLAAARMQRVHVAQAEDIQIALNQVGAECEIGRISAGTLERARIALQTTRTAGRLYFEWVGEAISQVRSGAACEGLEGKEIKSLLDAMEGNPNMRNHGGWRQDNLSLRASLALAEQDPNAAVTYFNRALDADPRPSAALAQAAQLGTAGYPAEGVAHLDYFTALPKPVVERRWSMAYVHARLLERQDFMQDEIAHLRATLANEAQSSADSQPDRTP